jgi:hypothetical protein
MRKPSSDSDPTDDPTRRSGPEPGFEEIPLDLSQVLLLEQGLADAARRYQVFIEIAGESLGPIKGAAIFREHLALVSFINRASSLHKAIVSAVESANPHAAFTLLRAYLELVVLVRYLDLHPGYLDDLEKPRPVGRRKRFKELFEDAASEMVGVRHVYALLSEMAHFGSTALWHPFTITDEAERTLSFSTAPHWKHPDDGRVALAMLAESDEAMTQVLRRYLEHHVLPKVERHRSAERIRAAFAAAGATPSEEGIGSLSPELGREALAAGLIAWCEEHEAMEVADGVTPERVERWVEERQGS